ncbi:alpha/beta-hydrolase [Cucurbitaria berberidis CBS 394.84]|uniref:Alpha/beta-hydrolase n=1 Tax=Cucurbitaria berberidis CBS 394.84 TaxID=1168544 RepID=A0A9P4GNM8_9PLEO|nr:alpha/beta-hydrolase [Cucurbitaria berberidis CBS 394.84]KAF1848320.1 alpha/beta-hydrolase [Cucurbitaria berberidis CBS 394.84]
MALQFIRAKSSILPPLFYPTYDAIFSTIPFWQRWRTLLLQPINLFVALITAPTWLFNNRYSVIYVPTRSGRKRCLVYQPSRARTLTSIVEGDRHLKPFHVDIHGGGYIGGSPEHGTRWCAYLSDQTGAVVISLTYRITPRYLYSAAHDDIDDLVGYLITHAKDFGVDPALFTIGGSSVGGSLALSACQYLHQKQLPVPKAWVGFYPLVDARLKAEEKPVPLKFPTIDLLSFLMPMYDVYGGTNRTQHLRDPRLHSTLAKREVLPDNMLFVVAGIDILLHEQLVMAERLKKEMGNDGDGHRQAHVLLIENGFHGFLELPRFVLEKERMEVFEQSVEFISKVHKRGGFDVAKAG